MRASEVTVGRTFVVAFDHGDDFFEALEKFCRQYDVQQGYIPMFIAGLSRVELVGACERAADPAAPVWSSVSRESCEAVGAGTIAFDPDTSDIVPHVHVAVGEKFNSAAGSTSHLLGATVQFLAELTVVEITGPQITRPRSPELYDVPLLAFGLGRLPAENGATS